MFWYLCLSGRKLTTASAHQIISETSWAAAGTPPIINYPGVGPLVLSPWLCIPLMHIACFASFRMQKLCAGEFDIAHPPPFALGRGINLQHTGCRAASFEWQIFCRRIYFAFRAEHKAIRKKYLCKFITFTNNLVYFVSLVRKFDLIY